MPAGERGEGEREGREGKRAASRLIRSRQCGVRELFSGNTLGRQPVREKSKENTSRERCTAGHVLTNR